VIAIYLAAAAILAAAALVGHAVCALCGARDAPPWAPVVGLALLMAVARVAIETPGRATAAAAATGALTLAGLVVCLMLLRRTRATGLWVERVPLAAGIVVLCSLPFLIAGWAGILGVGDNNDMSAHLTAAWWLGARGPVHPTGALGDSLPGEGYPFGPHALVAALARGTGISIVHSFDGLTLAVPALTAVAALGVLSPRVPRPARWTAAALIGLCYLVAAYTAQDAFKETLMGMTLVAFAVALRDLVRAPERPRALLGVPLGVIAAGAVYFYSLPGLVWLGGTIAFLLVLTTLRDLRLPLRAVRAALPATAAGVAALLVVAAPEAHHVWTFLHSSFAHEPKTNTGNLFFAIPAAEALGIWLQGDFRDAAVPYGLTVALDVLALVALAFAVLRLLRDRDLVVPAALLTAGLVAIDSSIYRNIYNTGKSLAILAPVVALALMPALADAWRRGAGRVAIPWRAAGAAIAAGAIASSFLALREAPVGPPSHGRQIEALARTIQGRSVLLLNVDDFAQWELRGTFATAGPLLYAPQLVQSWHRKFWRQRQPLDFDNYSGRALDHFDYVIASASAYQSTPPDNFHLVRSTRDFRLWRREGPTPERIPAEHGTGAAGQLARCGQLLARRIAAGGGVAMLLPTPLKVEQKYWLSQPRYPGQSGLARLFVPAGRWTISLQYASATGMTLRAGSLRERLPGTLERLGSFWPAGSFVKHHAGMTTIRVIADRTNGLGRLLHAQRRTRALSSTYGAPLGRLVLTPTGARPRRVPASAACGHYVDWYAPASAPAATP
jgi:hypothetical protein